MILCPEIQEYIDLVRAEETPFCKEQHALVAHIENCFQTEDIYVDEFQLHRYLTQQKYFAFKLFPWEKFIFALTNCTYNRDGSLRWPFLFCLVGRGAGKNGYLAFNSFCLLTPINGVKEYHVDIFANSEKQAKTSFVDVYNMLEANKAIMQRYFTWSKTCITNRKTLSNLEFRTSAPKTKDGGRPGAIMLDEAHEYENYKLIDVATTGLGKKQYPRRCIFSTDGYVRGGPLDDYKAQADDILFHDMDDCGFLPFICKLDELSEVDNPELWPKANPSYNYLPHLRQEIKLEYVEYKRNPSAASSFVVKRMDLPSVKNETNVTEWENIEAANKPLPDLTGCECVVGCDYMKTTDFLSVCLLFKKGGIYYVISKSWVCRQSKDLSRIKAPLEKWEADGLLEFVDGPQIPPEIPVQWVLEQAGKYKVTVLGMDQFRWTLLRAAFKEAGFDTDKGGANNVMLCKRITQMRWVPVITSLFIDHNIVWGKNPLMNWYVYNTCIVEEKGNQYYGKKEAKSRKTDGFMALVSAICASENLADSDEEIGLEELEVYSY